MGRSGQSRSASPRFTHRSEDLGRPFGPAGGATSPPVCSLVCEEHRRAPRGQQGQGFGRGRRDGVRQGDGRRVPKIAHEVRIPGFRPGKAPRRILEAASAPTAAREEALRDALPEYYAQAVRENDVDVIAPPEIDITARRGGRAGRLRRRGRGAAQGHVPGYDGLRVDDPVARAHRRGDRRADRAHAQPVRRARGRRAAGRRRRLRHHRHRGLAGRRAARRARPPTTTSTRSAAAAIVPELDEQLRGRRSRATSSSSRAAIPIPKRSPIDFRVLVKEVKERVLPELDDEWANEASEFETLDELRADLVSAWLTSCGSCRPRWRCARRPARRSPSSSTTRSPSRWSTTRCSSACKTSPCASRPRASARAVAGRDRPESARVRRGAAHRGRPGGQGRPGAACGGRGRGHRGRRRRGRGRDRAAGRAGEAEAEPASARQIERS